MTFRGDIQSELRRIAIQCDYTPPWVLMLRAIEALGLGQSFHMNSGLSTWESSQ